MCIDCKPPVGIFLDILIMICFLRLKLKKLQIFYILTQNIIMAMPRALYKKILLYFPANDLALAF